MIAAILGILTSSGFGAIIGLLGSWLTKKEEAKQLKQKYEYEAKMADIRKQEAEIELKMQMQMLDKKLEITQSEAEIQQDIANADAFKESLKEQSKIYKSQIVEIIRGLIRPVITIYLLAIVTYIAIKVNYLVGGFGSFNPDELLVLYKDIINQIFFMALTALSWWFGSRPTQKRK